MSDIGCVRVFYSTESVNSGAQDEGRGSANKPHTQGATRAAHTTPQTKKAVRLPRRECVVEYIVLTMVLAASGTRMQRAQRPGCCSTRHHQHAFCRGRAAHAALGRARSIRAAPASAPLWLSVPSAADAAPGAPTHNHGAAAASTARAILPRGALTWLARLDARAPAPPLSPLVQRRAAVRRDWQAPLLARPPPLPRRAARHHLFCPAHVARPNPKGDVVDEVPAGVANLFLPAPPPLERADLLRKDAWRAKRERAGRSALALSVALQTGLPFSRARAARRGKRRSRASAPRPLFPPPRMPRRR
jgi:hypothetical protein